MISGVPVDDIDWGRLKPFLENFAKRSHGRWTVEWLAQSIVAREKQVWVANDYQAVCLTSLGDDHVNIEACTGLRRHEWQEELGDEIHAWGRALGMKRIFAKARPGWAKYGKQRGYREIHREFMMEL